MKPFNPIPQVPTGQRVEQPTQIREVVDRLKTITAEYAKLALDQKP